MSLCKPCHIKSIGIKQMITLLIFLFVFSLSNVSAAEKTSLKTTVSEIQKEQTQLQNKLQQFGLVGNQVIAENKQLSKQVTRFIWIMIALAAILLGSIWFTLAIHKKYKIALKELQESSNKIDGGKQFQTNQIANLQKSISDQREQLRTLKQSSEDSTSQTNKEISQLHHTFNSYQQQGTLADEQLEELLTNPVDHTFNSQEKEKIRSLITDNNLSFSGNLKARALAEEASQAWQRSIDFWETVLIEEGKNSEAWLHIGHANYQLAIEDSRSEHFIDQSMQAFEKIMLSDPDYFDDMQGYDGEETLNEANDFNSDSKDYRLFQQLETFLMKLDELRNYQSIYMLACDYATDGKVSDAQNCLEQIPSVFHAPHCKQLQRDENLSVLKQFDWFNELIEDACQKSKTAEASTSS